MKPALVLFTLMACGICAAEREMPKQIRVSLQFIEVPHPLLTEMLDASDKSGQALHDKASALSKEGKARILETCMVVCRSGQKATVESIREEIYPVEYEPTVFPGSIPSSTEKFSAGPPRTRLWRGFTAFETRNTGVTFEVAAILGETDRIIELQLRPEVVTPHPLVTWIEHLDEWGDASIRMPTYESWKLNTSISVEQGKFELVSAITPKTNAPAPAVLGKILVFVRADILSP